MIMPNTGKDCSFYVYQHLLALENNNVASRYFIVLRNPEKVIVKWTNFHRYIYPSFGIRNIMSDYRPRFVNVCAMLNYLFFEQESVISSLEDISVEMVREYLNAYAQGKLPNDDNVVRRKKTVNSAVSNILFFLDRLLEDKSVKMGIRKEDIYRRQLCYSKNRKGSYEKTVPNFRVLYTPTHSKPIFRDMPDSVFIVMMNVVIERYPEILMLVASSAFAGLRPSECCNLRREDSPLGAGIRIEIVDGYVNNISLDLTHEMTLRSDCVMVGRIKKERKQKVYPKFLQAYMKCYEIYLEYMQGKKYEAAYGPLTVNRQGKAMTYETYCQKFKRVMNDVKNVLYTSEQPEDVLYAHYLEQNTIAPHVLRHWFSVKLTLYGEGYNLQYWRGDTSPESALTYLQNKSELEKRFKKVTDEMIDFQMWRAKDRYGKS